jgi:purine-binding chemotaxis protein CheW
MEPIPYLIFELYNSSYGIEATAVQEIFSLPELTPIAEAPPDIAGVLNLRGKIVPVMDLNRRFGYKSRPYQLSDRVIVLQWQDVQMGIIVDDVQEIQNIEPQDITSEISYGRDFKAYTHNFISGFAKIGTSIIILLACEPLIRYSESLPSDMDTQEEAETEEEETPEQHRLFCPHASETERATFRERAEALMQSSESQDLSGFMSLAVVELNGEYFGIDLQVVREFTDILQVTPIPCCPQRVVGNMNLRGEIVTLFDMREILNLDFSQKRSLEKAVVLQVQDIVAGMTVDEVFDITHVYPTDIEPIPAAVHTMRDEYLRGTAPYQDKMMAILDITKILTQGELEVNEGV